MLLLHTLQNCISNSNVTHSLINVPEIPQMSDDVTCDPQKNNKDTVLQVTGHLFM